MVCLLLLNTKEFNSEIYENVSILLLQIVVAESIPSVQLTVMDTWNKLLKDALSNEQRLTALRAMVSSEQSRIMNPFRGGKATTLVTSSAGNLLFNFVY